MSLCINNNEYNRLYTSNSTFNVLNEATLVGENKCMLSAISHYYICAFRVNKLFSVCIHIDKVGFIFICKLDQDLVICILKSSWPLYATYNCFIPVILLTNDGIGPVTSQGWSDHAGYL